MSSSSDSSDDPTIPKWLEITLIVLVSVVVAIFLVYVIFFHGKHPYEVYGQRLRRATTKNPVQQNLQNPVQQNLTKPVQKNLQNPKVLRLRGG